MVSPTASNLEGQFCTEAELFLLWLFEVNHALTTVVTVTVMVTAPGRTIRADGWGWGCGMRHGCLDAFKIFWKFLRRELE